MSGLITQGELDTTLNKKINDSDTNSKLNKQQIGSLPSLRTNSKDTLVNSINELFQYASNGKTLVANAITGKGIPSNSNMTFQQLATNISNINTGYSREDIESGKVVVNLSYRKVKEVTTSKPSNNNIRDNLSISDDFKYIIFGYHEDNHSTEVGKYIEDIYDNELNIVHCNYTFTREAFFSNYIRIQPDLYNIPSSKIEVLAVNSGEYNNAVKTKFGNVIMVKNEAGRNSTRRPFLINKNDNTLLPFDTEVKYDSTFSLTPLSLSGICSNLTDVFLANRTPDGRVSITKYSPQITIINKN